MTYKTKLLVVTILLITTLSSTPLVFAQAGGAGPIQKLQQQVDSFFDIFTDFQTETENSLASLNQQIDSFFDIFVPVDQHNQAVSNLQNQIDDIELMEGPPGPTGPAGPAAFPPSPPITKFMKIDGQVQGIFQGGSTKRGEEGSIEAVSFDHSIVLPRDAASGLPTGKRQHSPLVIVKEIDKATPLIYKALVNNENLKTVEFNFYRPNPASGMEEKYFTIKLTNANVASVKQINQNSDARPDLQNFMELEEISFVYQKIQWTWIPDGIMTEDDWEAPVA